MTVKKTSQGLISKSKPKERASGATNPKKGCEVRREELVPVEDRTYLTMFELARVEVEGMENNRSRGKIRLWHPGPLSWFQVKNLSKRLTAEFDVPILVLPKTEYGDAIQESPTMDEYCQFDAHVVLVRSEGGKRADFELATCHERAQKDKETGEYKHDAFVLDFPGEQPLKSMYKPELSFPVSRHVYTLQNEECNIIGYSEFPLELGQVYRVGGLMFRAADKKNTKATPFQEKHFLIDWAIPVRKTVEIDQAFFDKFKGLTHDQFVDSVAFPFENSISDYKELPFIAVFYIRSGTIPFNVFLVGSPGCTKSGFVKRMSSISGDLFVDGGSATLKGIMPSFSPKSMQVGVLGSSRYFALINEFLQIVKGSDKTEAPYNVLSTMKNILEGEKTHVPSGIGSMDIKMRGSTFIASNWIELGRGGRLASINDFYGKFDAAFLDRFFLFPVRQKTQMRLVDQHSEEVKDRMKVFEGETGIKDEIEILEKMQPPYPLTTLDLRTILLFKEQLTARLDSGARSAVNEAIAKIRSKHTYERFTRARDAISNIASAYAFERDLSGGKISPETKDVTITAKEIQEASEYVELVFGFYDGVQENEKLIRKEFYKNSASKGQRYIIDSLKERYLAGASMEECSVPFDRICDGFGAKYPEMDWMSSIRTLIQDRLAAYDGMRLIWLPDEMEDELVRSLFVGGSSRDFVSTERLRQLHLLDEKLHSGWIGTLPTQPPEHIQKLVRELCIQTPVKIEDLKVRAGLMTEVAENAVAYLHLSGEIWNTPKGFLAKPEGDGQK